MQLIAGFGGRTAALGVSTLSEFSPLRDRRRHWCKSVPKNNMLPAGFEPASGARKAPILDRARLRERDARTSMGHKALSGSELARHLLREQVVLLFLHRPRVRADEQVRIVHDDLFVQGLDEPEDGGEAVQAHEVLEAFEDDGGVPA